jgi:hypothetical protein
VLILAAGAGVVQLVRLRYTELRENREVEFDRAAPVRVQPYRNILGAAAGFGMVYRTIGASSPSPVGDRCEESVPQTMGPSRG